MSLSLPNCQSDFIALQPSLSLFPYPRGDIYIANFARYNFLSPKLHLCFISLIPIYMCISFHLCRHPDLWYTNVELPVLQDIKYRYLVVEKVQSNNSSGETINIIRWETMLHPRYCRFSLPGGHEGRYGGGVWGEKEQVCEFVY